MIDHLFTAAVGDHHHALIQGTQRGGEDANVFDGSLEGIHLYPVTNGVVVFNEHNNSCCKIPQQSLKHQG